MVLTTEEFLQAQKCDHVEASLEGLIGRTTKELRTCQASLKAANKQIENRKKEMEEIANLKNGLIREVIDIASKGSYQFFFFIIIVTIIIIIIIILSSVAFTILS